MSIPEPNTKEHYEFLVDLSKFTNREEDYIDSWAFELAHSVGLLYGYRQGKGSIKNPQDGYFKSPPGGFAVKVSVGISYGITAIVARICFEDNESFDISKSIDVWGQREYPSDEEIYKAYKYTIETLKKSPYMRVVGVEKFGNCDSCGEFSRLIKYSNGFVCMSCKYRLEQSHQGKGEAGFAYVIGDLQIGIYKIGCSRNPKNRLSQIGKLIGPLELELICTVSTDDKRRTERKLHARFSDKRKRGEWFLLNQDDIDWIKSMNESKE